MDHDHLFHLLHHLPLLNPPKINKLKNNPSPFLKCLSIMPSLISSFAHLPLPILNSTHKLLLLTNSTSFN